MSINVAVIEGRLVRDPEVRNTLSGVSVADFTVAVDRRVKSGEEKQADFIRVTAWRTTAEFVQKYFHKGDGIHVFGKIRMEQYQDRDGNNRTQFSIQAEEVGFPLGKIEKPNAAFSQPSVNNISPVSADPIAQVNAAFEPVGEIVDDDDLPF